MKDYTYFQRTIYNECRESGWDSNLENSFTEELALLHSEVSEALDAYRKYHDYEVHHDENGKPQGVPIELADVLLGLFYITERFCAGNLLDYAELKHDYNNERDYQQEGRQLY